MTTTRTMPIARIAIATCVAVLLTCAALAALPSSALAADKPLPTPKAVKAKATKQCTVKVTWHKVSGADGYTVYWSKNKKKGYKKVGKVSSSRSSFTHKKAAAGTKNYYKVKAWGSGRNGKLSKVAKAKVSSTFKNSFVKLTIPKYWRGKVYFAEKPYSNQFKSVYINDIKTNAKVAWIDWTGDGIGNGGDVATDCVKALKRGKGEVQLWFTSYATNLCYSKYINHAGNPSANIDGAWHQLTSADTNRLIKLQSGGKLSYGKVKEVPEIKVVKYTDVPRKYLLKNVKFNVVM